MAQIFEKYKPDLFEFLTMPTISAQSQYSKDMTKACKWLSEKLTQLSFQTKIMPTGGQPLVYAENLQAGKDKPTIIIYGHYDVQAPDPLEEWVSNPFEPVVRNGNMYGRGTADDKGQLYTWIAALSEIGKLPVNIKFLIEGEEEVGSSNLDNFIKKNKKMLKADICVISDSHNLSRKQPLIAYGLRGLVYVELNIKTLSKDVHSGSYGGNVLNPVNELIKIISKLKNDKHEITIPGFYQNVRKLSKVESTNLKKFPFTAANVIEETGALEVVGEKKYSVQERVGVRPTLDVNGIWGGYQQEGAKTIIPAKAGAKISMRLVPNQSSEEILKKLQTYIKKITPKGVKLELTMLSDGEPILMDIKSKYFEAAKDAYKAVFGQKPLFALEGGSIPVTATFKNLLNMDSVLMGYGLPDDGLHSPNEKLAVSMFEKGVKTNIKFISLLAS